MWLMVVLIAVVIAVSGDAKVTELRRRRAQWALALEGRHAELLVADPIVTGLPVVPSVHLPLWRAAPVLVVLKGHVPSPHLRDLVREVIRRGLAAAPDSYYLDDRLVVVGRSPIRRAA